MFGAEDEDGILIKRSRCYAWFPELYMVFVTICPPLRAVSEEQGPYPCSSRILRFV